MVAESTLTGVDSKAVDLIKSPIRLYYLLAWGIMQRARKAPGSTIFAGQDGRLERLEL
jgi:hypothetical protein